MMSSTETVLHSPSTAGGINQQYQLLMACVTDYAFVFLDADARVNGWNTGAERLFGYGEIEILGQPFAHLFTAEDQERGVPQLELREAEIQGRAGDDRLHLRKDGTEFWASGVTTALRDDSGTLRGFVKVLRDHTDRWREAEAQLQLAAIVDSSADAIIGKNLDGIITTWNPAAEQLYGWAAVDALGKSISMLVPADRPTDVAGIRYNLERGERVETFETVRVRKDGRRIDVELTVSPVKDATGTVIGAAAVSHDITDRKRVKEERDQLLSRLQLQIDRIPLAYLTLDADFRITDWNPAAQEVFGFTREEALGQKSIDLLVRPQVQPHIQVLHHRLMVGDMTAHSLNENVTKDGRTITCQWFNTPLLDAEGNFAGLFALTQDVTEQRRIADEQQRTAEVLRAVTDGTPDAVFVKDRQGRYLLFNPAAAGFVGRPAADVLGRDDTELFGPEGGQVVRERDRRVMETEQEETEEERLTAASVTRTYLATKLPYRDGKGRVIGVIGISRDITDRKRAEQRLTAQHAVTRALGTSTSLLDAGEQILKAVCASLEWELGALWQVDQAAGVLRCVQAWHPPTSPLAAFAAESKRIPYPPGTGLPGTVWAARKAIWFADYARDTNFPRTPLAAQLGLHGAFGIPITLGDDILGVLEFFSKDFRQPDQDYLEMMTAIGSQVGQFIERKRVEEGLRLFRALIDQTTDGVEVIDPETGRFLDMNERACVAHGYSRAEYLGLSVCDVDPIVASRPWGELIAERRLGGHQTFESQHRRKDGSTYPVEVNLNFIRQDREYVVAVVRDITERKQLEDQYRQAQKMEAVGQLAGGVAHDFNNLLQVINGYGDLVQNELPKGSRAQELVGEMTKAGERAAGLTRQLLAFSRQQVVAPKVLDLNEVVREVEKMLRRVIGEDIALAASLQPELATIKADAGQLEQVLLNLAVNARDAMAQGGKLTIETKNVELDADYAHTRAEVRPGRYVLLAVSDTGHGMTAEVQSRIFEPFFTTKETGKGTGLGLATVFGIVKQSGGHIGVYSEPGHGTTFKVYLPRVEEVVKPRKSAPGRVVGPRGQETLLLVEDDDAVRALTRHILKHSGYRLLEAANGHEALRLAAQHREPIHLLVSDVVMPGLGGRQVAEKLLPSHPEMKVLYLSGYTDDAVVRHGILNAEVNFLQKPFRPAELTRKVREVLDESTAHDG